MRIEKNNSGFLGAVEFVLFMMLVGFIVIAVNTYRSFSEQSEIKRDISNISTYKMVILDFKDKYGAFPGDFAGAKALWPDCEDVPSIKAKCDGNGNGIWEEHEGMYVFEHLKYAEFVEEPYKILPDGSASNMYPVLENTTKQNIVPIGALSKTDNDAISATFFDYPMPQNSLMVYYESNMPGGDMPVQKRVDPLVAASIDAKTDDGNGASGSVRAAYDVRGFFGNFKAKELCTYSSGVYKDDDGPYFCSLIIKY